MLKSDLKALVNNIRIEILYWKIVKSDKLDFLKLKIVEFNANLLIFVSLTSVLRALVSITH